MSGKYVVVRPLSSFFFKILNCETDQLVEHEVANKHGVVEKVPMQFEYRESAEYHADRLNREDAGEAGS